MIILNETWITIFCVILFKFQKINYVDIFNVNELYVKNI